MADTFCTAECKKSDYGRGKKYKTPTMAFLTRLLFVFIARNWVQLKFSLPQSARCQHSFLWGGHVTVFCASTRHFPSSSLHLSFFPFNAPAIVFMIVVFSDDLNCEESTLNGLWPYLILAPSYNLQPFSVGFRMSVSIN